MCGSAGHHNHGIFGRKLGADYLFGLRAPSSSGVPCYRAAFVPGLLMATARFVSTGRVFLGFSY